MTQDVKIDSYQDKDPYTLIPPGIDRNTIWPNKGNHIKRVPQDEADDENPSRTHRDIEPQTQNMCLCSRNRRESREHQIISNPKQMNFCEFLI